MKLFPILFFLFALNTLQGNNLTVQIDFGFCASSGSGQAIVLATGGIEPYSFDWSDPSLEGSEVFDLAPGNYIVTTTDASGCEQIENFEIPTSSDVWLNYFVIDISCFDQMDGEIIIEDFFPADLLFSIDGINFSDQTVFENLDDGATTIFILESNGCITEEELIVNEPPPLIIDLGPDVNVDLGNHVLLSPIVNSASSSLLLTWRFYVANDPNVINTITCNECTSLPVIVYDTTVYIVTVQDENGCAASDEISIYVTNPKNVYIPNIFTPNHDGFNDLFTVYVGEGVRQIKKFQIRDNFGSIVHETLNFFPDNIGFGWDGHFRGKRVDMGVFLYQVKVEYLNGVEEDIFGTVTLVY